MGSLDFPIELWSSGFDVDMPYSLVLDMPVKLRLELMSSVSSNGMNTKGKFFDHVIDEFDGMCLIMTFEDLQGPDAGGIIYSRILKSANVPALGCLERNNLHIHLHMVSGYFL
jgi:hypothetical protein